MNDLTHYSERAGAMSKSARRTACHEISKLWTQSKAAEGDIFELEKLILNNLREAGQKLNLASGREQLLFTLEGKDFVRKELIPYLPDDMGLNQVQACVHIAQHIRERVETREQVRAAKREFQLALIALGIGEKPQRQFQTAHTRNLFQVFVNRLMDVGAMCDDLSKEEPLESWPREKVEDFLESARRLRDQISRAEKVLLGRAG